MREIIPKTLMKICQVRGVRMEPFWTLRPFRTSTFIIIALLWTQEDSLGFSNNRFRTSSRSNNRPKRAYSSGKSSAASAQVGLGKVGVLHRGEPGWNKTGLLLIMAHMGKIRPTTLIFRAVARAMSSTMLWTTVKIYRILPLTPTRSASWATLAIRCSVIWQWPKTWPRLRPSRCLRTSMTTRGSRKFSLAKPLDSRVGLTLEDRTKRPVWSDRPWTSLRCQGWIARQISAIWTHFIKTLWAHRRLEKGVCKMLLKSLISSEIKRIWHRVMKSLKWWISL